MKVLKWIIGIIAVPYAIIAVFVTACLMCYNDYKITEFGDYSLIIVEDDSLMPTYEEGSLVVVKKNSFEEIKTNQYAFFYDTYDNQVSVNYGKIMNKRRVNEVENTYVIEGDYDLSSEFFIGMADTAIVYDGLGKVLSVLESRFGFLFIFVLPILVLFIYEIYAIVKEVRNPIEEEELEE